MVWKVPNLLNLSQAKLNQFQFEQQAYLFSQISKLNISKIDDGVLGETDDNHHPRQPPAFHHSRHLYQSPQSKSTVFY